jgi:pyruvate kinase
MSIAGNKDMISITYTPLCSDTVVGGKIMLADGLIALEITDIYTDQVKCKVLNSGKLGERKNVNLPNVKIQLPALAEKDKADLLFGCQQQVDYIAASFIRKSADMHEVRNFLDNNGGKYIKIIAKIENQEGLDNIDEIIELTDGVMVARGDLGVDIPLEHIPLAQKMMIHKCNQAGKLVITATQMLESMIQNPRPTRAEVTDIANAILDGTDAVMLSGETAAGSYPLEAVTVMAGICATIDPTVTENHNIYTDHTPSQRKQEIASELTCAIAQGAVTTAHAIHAACIVTLSNAGTTVRQIRKHNPLCPLVVLTPYITTTRQLMMLRGVSAYMIDAPHSYTDIYTIITNILLDHDHAVSQDMIVVTG